MPLNCCASCVCPWLRKRIRLSRCDTGILLVCSRTAELGPRMSVPFSIFMDKHEVTLTLDATDLGTMRHAIRDARIVGGFRRERSRQSSISALWVFLQRLRVYLPKPALR